MFAIVAAGLPWKRAIFANLLRSVDISRDSHFSGSDLPLFFLTTAGPEILIEINLNMKHKTLDHEAAKVTPAISQTACDP
jgi:hypothetical protein